MLNNAGGNTAHMPELNFIPPNWFEKINDTQLDGLVNNGFMVLNDCFDVNFFRALQKESGLIDYQAANLTQGERITSIRGDSGKFITG